MTGFLLWAPVKEKKTRRRGVIAGLTVVSLIVVMGVFAAVTFTGKLQGQIIGNPFGGKTCVAPAPAGPGDGTAKSRNAQIVANTGAALGVSQAGQIIGIAVTLVEAGGLNVASQAVPESINYPNDGVRPGDHDSVGIFQQRASWGTVQQRMDVQYAATQFFTRLLGVSGWEQMDPGAAAQKVQVSAFPDRYATQMDAAKALLAGGPQAPVAAPCPAAPAAPVGSGVDNGSGYTDGPPADYSGLSRSPAEAIAWARAQEGTSGWYRRCLAFVTQATGGWVGVLDAIDAYYVAPPNQRHDASSPEGHSPSPGAAMFYTTGSRAGHVVLYLGGGMIASNDILTDGIISIVPANLIETKWHSTYVGWANPRKS